LAIDRESSRHEGFAREDRVKSRGEESAGTVLTTLLSAFDQTWQPFVLILGLILIGHCATSDGLFESLGARLSTLPGGGVILLVSMLALVAVVTATLNLDTSVVFVTPIVLHAARRRGVDERAFLYGSIFMANAASLLLLGSNLTNILVFTGRHVRGDAFARTMFPEWISSIVLTAVVMIVWNWSNLRSSTRAAPDDVPRFRLGVGLFGLCAATGLMLFLSNPALLVLGVGIVAEVVELVWLHRTNVGALVGVANIPLLGSLFGFALIVAVVARVWSYPAHLMASAGPWATAAIGAGSANVINNLPASALLSSTLPSHPYELLLGLDLGPNLLVIGAMSSLLWLRIARQNGATPSIRTFSKVGAIVTIATLTAALLIIT